MQNILKRSLTALFAIATVVLVFASTSEAATKYSRANGRWDNANTWTPSSVPSSTDDIIIMPGHTVELGNTTVNTVYTIRSLEVRANGLLQSLNNSWRTRVVTTANGPTGYAVLNLGQIHGQINRTSVIECGGNLKTDGSGMTNRTSRQMGGFSWGWNNLGHSGNPWAHNHTGNNGDATPGICLILTGGTPSTPATMEQAATVNIDNAPFTASLDALPRTFIKGVYEMKSNMEMNAFESRVELGGELDLNGYRLQMQGPLHTGDPGFNTVSYTKSTSTQGTMAMLGTGATTIWTGPSKTYTQAPAKLTSAFPSNWANNQGSNGTFNFYGQNVRDIWVSINGWVGFLNNYTSSWPYNRIPSTFYANGIALPGGYYSGLPTTNEHVKWGVVGTAPNRELVIQWRARYFGNTTGTQFTTQCRLQEGSNNIVFKYGSGQNSPGTPNWNSSSMYMLIGIEDMGGNNGVVHGTSQWPVYQLEPNNTLTFTPQYLTNPTATLRIGDGTGTANQGTYPQFRVTAGAANIWGSGSNILIPNGENGSMFVGAAVQMLGTAQLNILGEPTVPSALQNGAAPTVWILGYFALGGTSQVNCTVPSNPANPTNSMLQVGQALDFLDNSTSPAMASSAVINLTGNHGASGFPVMLCQGGSGGGLSFITNSLWAGQPNGVTPGSDTAGMNINNSVFVHQGGMATHDSFKMNATGGNPGSLWGPHSIVLGLDQYNWQSGTVTIANGTNLEIGGQGTDWDLDGVGLQVKGNRQAVNGGGGNVFVSNGAKVAQYGVAANMPANGSTGMVDIGGNLQVTSAAEWHFGADLTGTTNQAGHESTLRVLGQGTIPPALGVGPQSLQRRAPLGNLSIDDGGFMSSAHADNVLVFIGEKWHSASTTVKVHPWKVENLISYAGTTNGPLGNSRSSMPLRPSGGTGPWTFSIQSGGGVLNPSNGITASQSTPVVYSCPQNGANGTAIVRCTDANGETFDAVISYRPKGLGTLMISPGYINNTYFGYTYYLRTNVSTFKPTVTFRAYGGSGTYSWSRSNTNGTLSGTSGQTVTFTAGTTTTVNTITLTSGTTTRWCVVYQTTSTFYGDYYPSPYYFRHLRVNETQTFRLRRAVIRTGTNPAWSFSSNGSSAFFTAGQVSVATNGATAVGDWATVNSGSNGGVQPYQNYTRGQVTWTNNAATPVTITGWFYMYVTALPTDLSLGPTEVAGWLPGQSFTFTGSGGGVNPSSPAYTYSLAQSGGGTSPSPTVTNAGTNPNRYGVYTAGGGSLQDDQVSLGDGTGNTVTATIKKGLATPANGNSFIAVPGAKTIFTNSTVNSVDQIVFADNNDTFGRFQVLKTLSSGNKVLPSSIEISPILLTMINGSSQTFTVNGGTGPYTYSIGTNNSGSTIGATTGVYTAGNTVNVADTVVVTDSNGKIARATVNVVNQGGASPLEIRPRYIYYFLPGQQFQFRTVGGKGGLSWNMTQNNSGGGINNSGLYTPGTPGGLTAWDTIQVSDASGDNDLARVGVYNFNQTYLYMFPAWCYFDTNTGAGKTRNGFMPGQTLNISTRNANTNSTWQITTNPSGSSITGNGQSAIWTAGNTGNVTDYVQVSSGSSSYTGRYKVQPPPMAITPSQASVFGGTTLTFSAQGGTGSYTYSVTKNNSGTTTVSGSGSTFTYTAGLSPGIDIVRVADGVSFADVAISVLGAANPTVINCNMLEVYHGELDLNGRVINVIDAGSGNPNGRGDAWFTNGGFSGATNPKLTMTATPTAQDPAQLNVGRTFIWNPQSDENVTAGTITVDGSVNITDNPAGPTFDLATNSGSSTFIVTGDNADYPTASPTRTEVWRATSTGGAPTMAGLQFATLQAGPSSNGTNVVRFVGPVCYNTWATQATVPALENSAGGTITQPANNCSVTSNVPPGFTQYTSTTQPSVLPSSGTVSTGVWITFGGQTALNNQTSTNNTCWTITGTVTIQGGLVIENGCVEIQGNGRLIVQGDVFVGTGVTVSQDRWAMPKLRFTAGTGGTPRLDVEESTPGLGGNFLVNTGGDVDYNTNSITTVEGSWKVIEDAISGTTVAINPANVRLMMIGAGQEPASTTSPTSSRLWMADHNFNALGITLRRLDVNKTNATDKVDLNSPVTVTNTFDVQSGDIYGTLGNGSVILTGTTWTNGANANYDTTGGTIGSNNWGPFNVYCDGTGSTTQSISASTGAPVPVLPNTWVRHSGTPAAGVVQLTSNVTVNNLFIADGRFDPNGNTLTSVVDVTVGLNVAADATNQPEIFMNGGTDVVSAGRHFYFYPGAVETVTAGTIEAGGDFGITDTTGSPFNLAGSTSLVRMNGPDVPGSPSRPAWIFSQDASNNPQTLQLNNFEINLSPTTSTVDLMSNVQVNGTFTLINGNVQGTNGTLLLAGNWTSTGGAYGNFLGGAIQIQGAQPQTFSSTIPVPPVTITKTGAGIVTLNGSFQTQGDLRLYDGVLDINGAVLTVNAGNLWVGIGNVTTDRAANPEIRANHATNQGTIRVLATGGVGGSFNFFGGCTETLSNCIVEIQRNGAFQEDTDPTDTNATGRVFDLNTPLVGAGGELRITGTVNSSVFLTDGPTNLNPVTLEVDDLTISKATVNDTVAFTSGIRVTGTYLHTQGTVSSGVIFVDGALFQVQGGAYNPNVSIVVASAATQTFTSTVTLPQLFINKPGANPLLVGNGATLQTGNFTIQDGTVDLNGGTLVVSGNFSVGTGTASDATNVPNFICSSTAGSANGGTLNVLHTTSTNGNFQFFEFCTGTVDTSTFYANGNVYVNDGSFAFTGTHTFEMRNNRGSTASIWADRPSANPVMTLVNLTLNKTPGGTGSQVDVGSDLVISGVFDVRGNTRVNGMLGTNGPIQLTGAGTVLTTNGTSGSFTSGTVIEATGTSNQTLTSGFTLGIVIVNKTAGTVSVGAGGLQTGVLQVLDGTLDLNGQTLTITGFCQIGNATAGSQTPTLLSTNAANVLQVIAPGSTTSDGTFFWMNDAQGTLSAGRFDIEGNLDVRSTTWAPTGTHKVVMFQNRGSAVTASANVTPTGYSFATLVLQDLEIAKTGTGAGTTVNMTLSDVAVKGLFTLTSGTVNTDTGSGAFILRLEGNSTGTGGSFTTTSWVSYEGTAQQTMGGTGGSLPNVQIQKTGTAPASSVVVNGALGAQSLLVLDGVLDIQAGANLSVVGNVTIGIGGNATNLTNNRTAAPEFRMSTSGTLSVGGNFGFWAGSVETINGGTLNVTGNLAIEEDSTGPKFDLSAATSAPTFNLTGATNSSAFLQDELGAAQNLELWHLTISKNTGSTLTVSGPIEVFGTFTMQSGTLATTGFGIVRLQGNWTHNGGTYAPGTQMALTGNSAQTLNATGGSLPTVTIDKSGSTAQLANGSTVTIGAPGAGELFWVKRGTFNMNGGTLVVNGIVFVGDNSAGAGSGYTPAPVLNSTTSGSVLDVNSTTSPPTGFVVDGDFVLQHNGTATNSAVNLTTGALRVEHRLAIDHTSYTSTLSGTPAMPTAGTPLSGPNFAVELDGNAGTQGSGEIFNLKGILTINSVEVVKTGGGIGAQARLLSGLDVLGNVLVTSGTFDLGNQSRIDLAGNWTVANGGTVVPTITQLWLGTNATNTITVNGGGSALFDVVINKVNATDQVIFTSTASPAQPIVVERQLLIYKGETIVTAGKQVTCGANSWLGNLLVGVTGITTTAGDATLDIQPGSTVALGTGATFAVDQNGVFEQVGTNAAARARLVSSSPGAGTWTGSVSGVWRAQWYEVNGMSAAGFVMGGTATFPNPAGGQALSDGLWDYPAPNGLFLDLWNGPTTPAAVYRNAFNNSGSVTAQGNIRASGATSTILYLNATGVLAGEALDVEVAGPAPVYWNVGTVDVTVATGTPPTSNVLAGTTAHPIGSFTLTETSSTEGVDVNSILVTSSQAITNLANITLYEDVDNSGTITTGDQNLGAPTSTGASTMTWSGTPFLQIASGGAKNLLVVADIGAAATGTFTFSVQTSTNITGVGGSFGVAIQVTGAFPVVANGQTVATSGLLTTTLGAASPAAGNIVPNSTVVMGQWVVSAGTLENHTVTGFTFQDTLSTALGTANITDARVVVDVNNNGTYEAGTDTTLAALTSPATVWNTTTRQILLNGFSRTINAGGSLTVLFVQTFTNNVSAATPDAFNVSMIGITSTGVTSTNNSGLGGLPSASTTQTVATAGSLNVSVGPNNPATTAVVRTAANQVMGQFRVQASQAESLSLTQVVVTNSGTGAGSNVTQVRVAVDTNNNGAYDGADVSLGTATLTGTTATISISRTIPASGLEYWLVVYDFNAPVGELGNTHNATLAAGSISGTGVTSTNALQLTGTPVSGGAKTLTDGAPILTVSTGANDPGAGSVSAGSTGVTLLQANLAATGENQTVTAVQVILSGSANDALAISGLYLVDDANNNGIADTGELSSPIAGPVTVPTDNATINFTGLSYQITSPNSRDLLIVADTNASGVQNGQTIQATIGGLTVTGDTSGAPSSTPGLPRSGGIQTLAVPGTLTVSSGAFMPGNQSLPAGTTAAPVWQGRVSANNTEDLMLTSFQVTQNSGAVGVFGAIRLYWDANGNGLLDGPDVALTTPATLSGTSVPLSLATPWTLNFRVSKGTSQNLLLVADIAGSLGQQAALSVQTGGVTVQGISSGLNETTGIGITGLPVAGGTVTVGAAGSVVVYTGANTSPSRTEPAGTAGVPIGQFTLRASTAEAGTLNSITFTGFPAGANDGDESTELGNITLFEDVDGDGRVSATEATNNQLGTAQTYGANNGTVTFGGGTPLNVTIPAGGDLHVVLVYDVASGATNGSQFLVGITTGAGVSVTGQTTSTALTVTPAAPRSNFLTVGAGEALAVSAGSPFPASRFIPPASLPATALVSVLRLEASAGGTGVAVSGLTITPSGIGNDAGKGVAVYDDSTGSTPGVVDGGDTLLGTGTYPGDNQPWTMSLSPAVQINAGTTVQWLVTASIGSANYGDTFEMRVVPAADVAATGVLSGGAVTATGSAIQGATITIASAPNFAQPVAVTAGSSGGGCFVATAAAGYDSSLVAGLIQGRDTLLPAAIVSGYYRTSPPVAAAVAAHPGAAAGVRAGLTPFAGWAASGSLAALLGLMILAALAVVVTRRREAVVKA